MSTGRSWRPMSRECGSPTVATRKGDDFGRKYNYPAIAIVIAAPDLEAKGLGRVVRAGSPATGTRGA